MSKLRHVLLTAVVCACLGGPLAASASAANTYSVAPGGDGTVQACTGSAPSFTCPNLRSAVAAAENANGSTINLQAGTYNLSTGHLSINPGTNSLSIAGAGASQTTIQQTGAFRVMNLNSGTMTLSGLTVTGGDQTATNGTCSSAPVFGGGILNSGTLTLDNVTVSGNQAVGPAGANASSGTAGSGQNAIGGGICSTGSLTLEHSTVTGNSAIGGAAGTGTGTASGGGGGQGEGGGIYSTGPLTISDSTIGSNHATGGTGGAATGTGDGGEGGLADGGGIALFDLGAAPSFSLTSSTVNGNVAAAGGSGDAATGNGGPGPAANGGAIHLRTSATSTISLSTISQNASTGGAAGSGSGSGHHAGTVFGASGAILSDEGPLVISSSSVTANNTTAGQAGQATGGATGSTMHQAVGGGIEWTGNMNQPLTLVGSTISGNTAIGGQGNTGSPTGGGAVGGGVRVADPATIVNTTITGNAVTAGPQAFASGGGLDDETTPTQPVKLQSVTLAGNSASAPTTINASGGNFTEVSATATLSDTIVSGGSSSGTGSNCSVPASTDGSHDLESTSPSQCGFSAANGDLIGSDPLLGPLASNGGPTQTMALGAGSLAIHAGGQCTDPTNGGAPLQNDQRGLPRHNPCDIGAFEGQAPGGAPTVTGRPAVGKTLTCSTSSITGDGPLSFASYQWLRNGAAISGATMSSYKVATSDLNKKLACSLTATDPFGSATLTSSPVTVFPVPKISGLKQSHKKWRRGGKLARIAKRTPVGDTFTFKLSADAKLTLTFTHKVHGHKRTAGKITFKNAHAGKRKVKFQGRLSRHKKLKPGAYTLKITASNSSGHSTSKGIRFTIVA